MSKGLHVSGCKISKDCLNLSIGQSSKIEQSELDELLTTMMRTDQAHIAVAGRAGCEFWRFIKRHNRQPNALEMERILANSLNRVARRLFEWRTGIDGLTGKVLADGPQPRLREVILPIYRDACSRETALKERFFSHEHIQVTHFKPLPNYTEKELEIWLD
jgi:hypothetical protein